MKLARSTKIVLFISLVLLVAQAIVSSKLTAIGRDVLVYRKETQRLDRENQILEQKIASESSLINIAKNASKLGLKKPAKIQFVDDIVYVVQR